MTNTLLSMTKQLSTEYVFIFLFFKCLYSIKSDPSGTVGQNPSIVYTPYSPKRHPSEPSDVFLIFNSVQGLETMYCKYSICDSESSRNTLKCGVKLYSTALLAIEYRSSAYTGCNKRVEQQITNTRTQTQTTTLYCTYYMVVGYGLTSESGTSYLSFITCYDDDCSAENMEEIIIDTMFESDSKTFGYDISLTTYTNATGGVKLPMFTYSKYSTDRKQFILNVIICRDFFCSTWIGKTKRSFASEPPFLTLGVKPAGDGSVAKGVVSIKETWSSNHNYASIMFTKNINITNNKTSAQDVYVLAVGTCALNVSQSAVEPVVPWCELYRELNTAIINEQIVSINTISMTEYIPPNPTDNAPLFITAYVVNTKSMDELWVLYCFNILCNSDLTTYYRVHKSKFIHYPIITLSAVSYHPNIVFFENSTSVMVMSCGGGAIGWNCTENTKMHPTHSVFQDTELETASMQISVVNNYQKTDQTESFIVFSQVMNSGGGAGIYNGSMLIWCTNSYCTLNSGATLLPFAIHTSQFTTSLDVTVFVIMCWILTFVTIFGILAIYKCISPSAFMSRNIRNAYLNKVSLDSSRIRPISYWFFFINLLCSAMCVVPWFAYFNVSDFKLYSLMIIAPFVSVMITLLVLITLHVCPLTTATTNVLAFISIVYWGSTVLLSYSFSFVWNLESENCETSDLSGLKIVILTGHVATCLVVEYILFWNMRCFQAIRLASPERLRDGPLYFLAKNKPNNELYAAVNARKAIRKQEM